MSALVEKIATVGIAVAAAVIAASMVHREMGARALPPNANFYRAPTRTDKWDQLRPLGVWIGDSTAPVKIVVFTDYECPFCKKFHERYLKSEAELTGQVALLMIPRPLSNHRFAMPAEIAAECSVGFGRFREMSTALFAKQDSFGLKSWASYATDAGIGDTISFSQCTRSTKSSPRLTRAIAVGDSLEVNSTPTVLFNGWRFAVAPYDSLSRVIAGYAGVATKTR